MVLKMERILLTFTCILFYTLIAPTLLDAAGSARVLVISSNASVEKYKEVQEEFIKGCDFSIQKLDLRGTTGEDIKIEPIQTYNPDLVYCIGVKAYTFARHYFEDKYLLFSSTINWMRLPLTEKTYGISNELLARMPLTMVRYIFPEVRKIGVLYSTQYTEQWFEASRNQAAELNMELVGSIVSDKNQTLPMLKNMLLQVNALWLIPDPMVMPEKTYLYDMLKACDEAKIPVFSYHEAFASIGAALILSPDNPTIGRQAAAMSAELLSGILPADRVQWPAGSHVILNMKKVKDYGLNYNANALSLVNTILK
jgi:putative ABC transport system substrate-binding protein